MVGKTGKPEDVVLKLRQFEVPQEHSIWFADDVRQIGVTVQTYDRWFKQYSGTRLEQLTRSRNLRWTQGAALRNTHERHRDGYKVHLVNRHQVY